MEEPAHGMTVAPFGEVKKQVGLETEEAVPVEIENEVKEPESAVPTGSEDITEEDTALEDDVKSRKMLQMQVTIK